MTSLKRIAFAAGGFILWIISTSIVMGSMTVNGQPNVFVELICFAIFVLGIIMFVYALKLKE